MDAFSLKAARLANPAAGRCGRECWAAGRTESDGKLPVKISSRRFTLGAVRAQPVALLLLTTFSRFWQRRPRPLRSRPGRSRDRYSTRRAARLRTWPWTFAARSFLSGNRMPRVDSSFATCRQARGAGAAGPQPKLRPTARMPRTDTWSSRPSVRACTAYLPTSFIRCSG